MSGALFLGIVTLMAIALFFIGRRFARMTKNPWRNPIEGHEMSVAQVNRIGRLQMIVAPLFWLFAAALSTGLLGPVEGVEPIRFN